MLQKYEKPFHDNIFFTESSLLLDEASQSFRKVRNPLISNEDSNTEDEEFRHTMQKCIQTSFSATNLTSRRRHSVRKINSDEDCASKIIHNEVIHSYTDICKADAWRQKLERSTNKPSRVEHKMKKKLKKCLQLVASQLSEFEEDTKQLKSDLTHIIVKKLTKMCLKTEREKSYSSSLKIYRVEVPKYVAHENIEGLKRVIEKWLSVLPIKKRNSQGNNIGKKEIAHSLLKKLKPIISNRYKDRKSYWYTLRNNVLKFLEDLPVMTEKNNKGCLNRYANMLVHEILTLSNVPKDKTENTEEKRISMSTTSQNKSEPTKYDKIQLFVRDEMFKFLSKVNLNYSDEIKDAEIYLVNFLNAVSSDVSEINNVEEDLSNVLQNVGKWPLNQANYFVNKLIRRFNVFLKTNLAEKEATKNEENNLCVLYHGNEMMNNFKYHDNWPTSFTLENNQTIVANEVYYKQLIKKVNDWLTRVDFETPTTYKNSFVNIAVSDLVENIIRKRQDLSTGEYILYVKFQILKWVKDNLGEESKIIERASNLVADILNIAIPKFSSNLIIFQSTTQPTTIKSDELSSQISFTPYEEQLVEIIFDWIHDLPANMHSSQNATLENQLVKDLASNLSKGQKNTDRNNFFDSEIDNWLNKVLTSKPKASVVNILKKKIKDFPFINENVSIQYKVEKDTVRRYEDIIDDWLNTIPIEPRKEFDFAKMKIDLIHELASKIYKVKDKNSNDLADTVKRKLESNISDWLTKIPIHPRADRKSFREQYARKLLKNIQEYIPDESVLAMEMQNDFVWKNNIVKDTALDWLKELPLHKNSDLVTKKKQEKITNNFAKEYTSTSLAGGDVNGIIKRYVQMLCEGATNDDVFIENTYRSLQSHLNNNLSRNVSKKFELSNLTNSTNLRNADRREPPLSSDIIFSAILDWSSTLPLKPDYCPRSFKTLLIEMTNEITKLIVHPEHSLVEDNNDQIKQKIFEYVSNFPLRPDNQLEQICDMIANLCSILKDIHLYRDDNVAANLNRDDSMFKNNLIRSDYLPRNSEMLVFGTPGLSGSFQETIQKENQRRLSAPASLVSKNIHTNVSQNVSVMARPGASFVEFTPKGKERRHSASAAIINEIPNAVQQLDSDSADLHGMNRQQLYEHFHRIFTEYCQEIPLDVSTPEDKILADMARQTILNGIWKAFSALLSDADIADDYNYFSDLMEDRLNGMLDIILPKTADANNFKANFVRKTLKNIINMLRYLRYITNPQNIKDVGGQNMNINDDCSTSSKINPEDVFVSNRHNYQNPIVRIMSQQGTNNSVIENMTQNVRKLGILGTSQVAGPSRQLPPIRPSPLPKSVLEYKNIVPNNQSQLVHNQSKNVSLGQRYEVQQSNQMNQNLGQTCNQYFTQPNILQSPQANIPSTIINSRLSRSLGPQSARPTSPLTNIRQTFNQSFPQTNILPNQQQNLLRNPVQSSGQSVMQSFIQNFEQLNAMPLASQNLRLPEGTAQRSQPSQGSQGTVSTARVTANQGTDVQAPEELDRQEMRYRCRCFERLGKCRRRRRRCFPLPFPYGYFY